MFFLDWCLGFLVSLEREIDKVNFFLDFTKILSVFWWRVAEDASAVGLALSPVVLVDDVLDLAWDVSGRATEDALAIDSALSLVVVVDDVLDVPSDVSGGATEDALAIDLESPPVVIVDDDVLEVPSDVSEVPKEDALDDDLDVTLGMLVDNVCDVELGTLVEEDDAWDVATLVGSIADAFDCSFFLAIL